MIVVLDNYDSFVHNLARYVEQEGMPTRVVRSDAITLKDLQKTPPQGIVVSPGPGKPSEAGISNEVINFFSGRCPILGVCLGHQCIGEVFGGQIKRAKEPMHGRSSRLRLTAKSELFDDIPDTLHVGRYHSLIVTLSSPSPLKVTAQSEQGEIMAFEHKEHPTWGVQFHPESILTDHGHTMIRNFVRKVRA